MKNRTLHVFLSLSILVLAQANIASAVEPDRTPVLEGLPPHLHGRLMPMKIPGNVRDMVEHQVLAKAKLWPAGARLKVSFMEGVNQDICRKIATIANEWTKDAVNISFDFGQTKPDDDCRVYSDNDGSVIRISFRYPGYWSLIGQDSRTRAYPWEPTMNFEAFDFNAPPEPEFSAVILHEFGHALGFHHEHQHPTSHCEDEFNWPIVYDKLKLPPNGWDVGTVNRNLRRLTYLDFPLIVSNYNKNSIMHYHFEPWMFKNGEKSDCYVPRNTQLSPADKLTAKGSYPPDTAAHNKETMSSLENLLKKPELDPDTRQTLLASYTLHSDLAGSVDQRTIPDLPVMASPGAPSRYAGLVWDAGTGQQPTAFAGTNAQLASALKELAEIRAELTVTRNELATTRKTMESTLADVHQRIAIETGVSNRLADFLQGARMGSAAGMTGGAGSYGIGAGMPAGAGTYYPGASGTSAGTGTYQPGGASTTTTTTTTTGATGTSQPGGAATTGATGTSQPGGASTTSGRAGGASPVSPTPSPVSPTPR